MKTVFLIVISSLLTGSALSQERLSGGKDNLQLTTKIVRQRYCDSGYSDMAQLSLSLQLTYINVGLQPLILFRQSSLPHYVLVSLNEENARNKQYELNQHVSWVTSGEPKLNEGAKPGKEFVVLSPGETYNAEALVSTPIALEPHSQFLKGGKYVLQIVVDAWPLSDAQFDRLRSKWKQTGSLCGPTVKSEPMSIEVEKKPKIVVCK